MKGLILSGGHGTRLRPLTYSLQKQLIPVANKPMLFYCIEDLINAGVKDIGIVVGPNKEQVMEAVRGVKWKANIEFIFQETPGGLAHAVKISRRFLGKDKFIMYLGDNILKGGIRKFAEDFKREKNVFASLLLTYVEDPERFGLAHVDEQNKVITKLVEKPKKPTTNLSIVGIYGLSSKIFEAIENIKPSWRGELEITDALQWLIDNRYVVKYKLVEGWWKDTGKPEDIIEANRLILESLKSENFGEIQNDSVICRGKVAIGKGTIVKGKSVIKGPVLIGENCMIEDSYLGPFTTVGNGCQIIKSEIEDSLVMEGSKIIEVGRISDSLIGKAVTIKKSPNLPMTKKFVIGDNSRAEL